jgi:polyisoprenyl-phosphate glycosyltransferase
MRLGVAAPPRPGIGPALVSVVAPVFNEHSNLGELIHRLKAVFAGLSLPHEIVFVDDGSTDGTAAALDREAAQDPALKVLHLSRNFGHQVAVTAGMDAARGEAVIVMDGDLQDPPELIGSLAAKWREGYDVVYAVRKTRKGEPGPRRFLIALFYRLLKRMTHIDIPLDVGDFRLMSRRVVDIFLAMPERQRFVRGMIAWIGFRQTGVEYDRDPRFQGESKYPMAKLLKLALDGITSFSYVPLQMASYLGFACALMSFILIGVAVAAKIFDKDLVPGWTSTAVFVLFIGGIQLLVIGTMGEYMGRMHEEQKKRPVYIVDRAVNLESPRDSGKT